MTDLKLAEEIRRVIREFQESPNSYSFIKLNRLLKQLTNKNLHNQLQ